MNEYNFDRIDMKKIIYNIIIFVGILLLSASCEDMMSIHGKYTEGGEIIYAPKLDSIAFLPGKGEIMFRYWLYNSPNVKSVDVFWNNGADSLIIPVNPDTGTDSSEVLFTNLPERSYTFDVYTRDKYGNISLTSTGASTSYGDNFQKTLLQRKIKNVSISDKGGKIEWFAAAETLAGIQIRYLSGKGDTLQLSMAAESREILCPDVKAGSSFSYRSLYLPEKTAIDTFAVAWQKCDTPFPSIYEYDKSDWKIVDYSDQEAGDGGGVETLIDGDLNNWWHSQYSGSLAPLPHWAVIDLTSPKKICKIDTWRRPACSDSRSVQYWTSDDYTDDSSWVEISEGMFVSGDLLTMDIPDPGVTTKRYLKILLPDSNRSPITNIAEISLYGK